MKSEYDFVVIGGGAAGFGSAIKASELGASVAMIEQGTIGGTCVNVGCVPSKRLLTVGDVYYYENHDYKGVSLNVDSINLSSVIKEKDSLVQELRSKKYSDVINGLPNATLIEGSAKFLSRNQVKVDGKNIRGKHFLIATGSSPHIPPFKGIRDVDYLTNVEALSPRRRPDSLLIIGGRALALEFAQMYAHFGTKVTVLQRSSRIIPEEEPEISDALRGYLKEEGIEIHTRVEIKEVSQRNSLKTVSTICCGEKKMYSNQELLVAAGRKPNTSELGLGNIDVKLREDGAVMVNDEMETSVPNIWAGGDVIGQPMLETVAAKEGAIAAHNALSQTKRKMDFNSVPHAVFTMPQVASVGLTDAKANQSGFTCTCNSIPMSSVPKAKITGDTRGLVKLVVDRKSKRIRGVHILSPIAADMIHEGVLAVKFKLTIDDLIDTVHVFPTMSEAIKLAAQSFYRDIDKMSCCTE
ncbi:MAG: mercury(II) reductase [Thaumarchaeota archaeon]|nr:mercury(II) reductase [Nitrososphaerota archaeon]